MTETLQYVYTTNAEMERLMSEQSMRLFLDDDQLGEEDANMILDVQQEATDIVNVYVQRFYTPVSIKDNLWVHRMCTRIACHLLTMRRGNPGAFQDLYNSAIEWLEKIYEGKFQIPRVPQRGNVYPAHSNLVVDDRFATNKLRVEQQTSTGGRSGSQDVAPGPYQEFGSIG